MKFLCTAQAIIFYIFSFLLLPKLNNARFLETGASRIIVLVFVSIRLLILARFASSFIAEAIGFAEEGGCGVVVHIEFGECVVYKLSTLQNLSE